MSSPNISLLGRTALRVGEIYNFFPKTSRNCHTKETISLMVLWFTPNDRRCKCYALISSFEPTCATVGNFCVSF